LSLAAVSLLALAAFSGHAAAGYASWVRLVSLGAAGTAVLLSSAVFLPAGGSRLPGGLPMVYGLAILARLLVFPAPFTLSEDAARYHWDGKVLAHGVNPYAYSPDAPELSDLPVHPPDRVISDASRKNHAVYPPLAEVCFAVAYLLTPGRYLGLRLLWLAAEAAAWILLARELAIRGRPRIRSLLLAWSPLLLTSGYLPGHVDMLGLPFVVLFLGAVRRRRPGEAGIWLALAILLKPFPVIFLPAVWAEFGTRRFLRFAGTMAGVVVLAYLPFAGAGSRLLSSTWLMAREWSFNAGLVDLVALATGAAAARILCAVLFVALVAGAIRGERDFLSRLLMISTAFVVCTPFLFPWYVFFLLPLVALRPDPALLVLVALLPIADLVAVGYEIHGTWEQPLWTRLALWCPFYGLLGFSWFRRRGMFGGEDGGPRISRSFARST
jgi:hypothetical protein